MPMHKSGKKNRKHKRNQEFCQKYKLEGREEKNKAKKREKHLKAHPRDTQQNSEVTYTRKRPLSALDAYLENNLPKTLDKHKSMC